MKQIILAILIFCAASPAFSAEETKFKALLVSIEKYEIAPLDFAVKDVSMLATILMTRYGCETKAYINSAATQEGESPKDSIMREISSWCNSIKDGDTALLYLSGHGVKDEEGKIHLAMINFDTKNFATAAIPIQWIRENIQNAKASTKVIFLDTCFSGTGKNAPLNTVSAEEASQSFSGAENVVVLSSSQANEQSWLWGEAKHSLFTYWLIEALKGHADRDDDRTITFAELTGYLREQVTWTAQNALGKSQHPVVLNEHAGKDVNFPLRAVSLSDLIEDVAEQIDIHVELEHVPLVAVSELTTGVGNTFEREYGTLPKWITDSIRRSLASKAKINRKGYKVVNENTTMSLFRAHELGPEDIGTMKTANLAVDGQEIPLLVTGKLNFIGETGITLRVHLINAQDRSEYCQIGGTARLNSKEMAMAGVSGRFSRPQTNTNVAPAPVTARQRFHSDPIVGLLTEDELAESKLTLQAAQQPHPLADPGFAWKTAIEVRPLGSAQAYESRPLEFIGNDCYLPLSKGEEYQIRVFNGSGQLVFARVLVDGLNTLSQRRTTSQSKGAFVAALDDDHLEFEVAPRVSLEDARALVLVPKVRYAPISGYINAKEVNSTVQRFQIVDADQSEAARKGYTDQIGLITVGFFKAVKLDGTMRNIGSRPGAPEPVSVQQYQGKFLPGDMIAAYNIRYVTPEMLAAIKK